MIVSIDTTNVNVGLLEASIEGALTRLVALELRETVVSTVDPCGASGGYDEVLLLTSKGNYIAYFEQGGKRFLTVLPKNGSFRTTDSQACDFRMVLGNYVENN